MQEIVAELQEIVDDSTYPPCRFNKCDNDTNGDNSDSNYNDNNNDNNGNTDDKSKNINDGNIHFCNS